MLGYVGISARYGDAVLRRMGATGELLTTGLIGLAAPLRSDDGRFALVYDGAGYHPRQVLAAWERWDVEAFGRLAGRFALAVADLATGEVTLAGDPAGARPVYYVEDGDGRVAFASAIRPVLTSGVAAPRPGDPTVYRFLRPRTRDSAGLARLRPGCYAVITPDGELRQQRYPAHSARSHRLAG
jgi:asparagine synthetase B (glutamine-hydrolysing)